MSAHSLDSNLQSFVESKLGYPLNGEQIEAVAAAITGGTLKISAGAGTGKTSTLLAVAWAFHHLRQQGQPLGELLYVAYNKAIQTEAEAKFTTPEGLVLAEARTAHSLAYKAIVRHPKSERGQRLRGKTMRGNEVAALFHMTPFHYQHDGERQELETWRVAILANESITRFCNSARREVSCRDIPRDIPVPLEQRDRLCNHILPYLQAMWADITNDNGVLPWKHDYYLKMWSLTDPKLNKVPLFDEAQDANPCIAHVIDIQDGQRIMVGDSAQAIYGWRGAVDAMANFNADHHVKLTRSYRFGQAVADQANRWLTQVKAEIRLTGFEQINSVVEVCEAPDTILCRSNAGCIEAAMSAQENGRKVAIVGGTREIESFCKSALRLMSGKPVEYGELAVFHTWQEVQEAVKNGEASDIGMLVRLVDQYGAGSILNVCEQSTKPEDADVRVSTAHKAKGLEWDSVRIHSDFKAPQEDENGERKLSLTEAMLIYVAVTRAKKHLDNSALAWLDDFEADLTTKTEDDEAGA